MMIRVWQGSSSSNLPQHELMTERIDNALKALPNMDAIIIHISLADTRAVRRAILKNV